MGFTQEEKSGLVGAATQGAVAIGQGIGAGARQKRARKWQLEDWDRVNKYNHPQAQMQRLKEAKLNPNLVYGQSSGAAGGNADAINTYTPDTSAGEEVATGVGSIPTSSFDAMIKKSTNDKIQADIKKTQAETSNTILNTLHSSFKTSGLREFTFENQINDATTKERQLGILDTNYNLGLQTYRSKIDQARLKTKRDKLDTDLKSFGLDGQNVPPYLKLLYLKRRTVEGILQKDYQLLGDIFNDSKTWVPYWKEKAKEKAMNWKPTKMYLRKYKNQ